MDRAYVLCHMYTSIDGKVTGKWVSDSVPNEDKDLHPYFHLHEKYLKEGYNVFAYGRATLVEDFLKEEKIDYSKYADKAKSLNYEDDIKPLDKNEKYFLCFDRKGGLYFTSNSYDNTNFKTYDKCKFIEITTEQVSKEYLTHLKEIGVPYIIGGKEDIDIKLVLTKLKNLGVEKVLLEGGPTLNGSFIKSDCLDEVSMVVTPLSSETGNKSIFYESVTRNFNLKSVQKLGKNTVHLVYTLNK